jgi:hypothetical protein
MKRPMSIARSLTHRVRDAGPRAWKIAAGGAVAAAAVVTAAVVWWPSDEGSGLPDPRARVYRDVGACLLTGSTGITQGTPGAPVWAAMEKASVRTRVPVTYTPVMGQETEGNAQPYLNTLVHGNCGVVIAVGTPQVSAAEHTAKDHPKLRFVVVDGKASAANVTVARSGGTLARTVDDAVAATASASGGN